MRQPTAEFVKKAVLSSYETSAEQAAQTFGIELDELHDWRAAFIDSEVEKLYPPTPLEPGVISPPQIGWLTALLHDPYGALGVQIGLSIVLIIICYLMPHLLESLVDPLTNTVIWLGFTSLYVIVFVGMGIDLVLFIQHKVSFDFMNPLKQGGFDYTTLLRSDNLSSYEKCRLNQQKYLAYLFAYCMVVWALASLTSGGGV